MSKKKCQTNQKMSPKKQTQMTGLGLKVCCVLCISRSELVFDTMKILTELSLQSMHFPCFRWRYSCRIADDLSVSKLWRRRGNNYSSRLFLPSLFLFQLRKFNGTHRDREPAASVASYGRLPEEAEQLKRRQESIDAFTLGGKYPSRLLFFILHLMIGSKETRKINPKKRKKTLITVDLACLG